MDRRDAVRLNPFTAFVGFVGVRNHLMSDRQVRQLIARWIEITRFDQAKVPLAVTATDADTGEGIAIAEGDVSDAVAASAAVPGLLPPVRIEGRWMIDGSLAANLPILEAQALGAGRRAPGAGRRPGLRHYRRHRSSLPASTRSGELAHSAHEHTLSWLSDESDLRQPNDAAPQT
jgi:predicted acylesterase/phospholipase RssA